MAKSVQSKAEKALHDIWHATTREGAERTFDHLIVTHESKFQKAASRLLNNRESLMTFYDFQAVQ